MTASLSGALAIGMGWALFGLGHSFLARELVKERARRFFREPFYNGYYRISYNLLSLVAVAYLWLQPGNLAGDVPLLQIPFPFAPAVFLIKGAALLIGIDAFRRIGFGEFSGWRQLAAAWQAGAVPGREGGEPAGELAWEGVYLWVRHPLNTATFMWVWSQANYTLYQITFAACVTVYILAGNHFEEYDLIRRFGRAYQNYQLEVPSFLGPFWRLKQRRAALESAGMHRGQHSAPAL